MAQKTKLLLQNLLKAFDVPASSPNLQESLLQILSDDSSGRANQFDVQARLNGLVEKAWILNNGAVGDALQLRLEELPKLSDQWTPDILQFLLALSDRPLHNTRVEDLASLSPDPPAPPLTWGAIIEEDPLEDQTAVWRDIDYAADGSDEDEDIISQHSENLESAEALEVSGTEDTEPNLESLTVAANNKPLEEISAAQAWRKNFARSKEQQPADHEDAIEILEINLVREIIFMLLGLPSSIFRTDEQGGLRLQGRIKLLHTSSESVNHLINSFLVLGQKLSTIQDWVKQDFGAPLEQSFQSALEGRMRAFHSTLHNIQKTTLDRPQAIVVSIVDVFREVNASSRLLVHLFDLLTDVKEAPDSQRPFRILEVLYEQTCMSQKVGDDEVYIYMAQIFFQCFQIYLRPIQAWMETGNAESHSPTMFVEKANEYVAPHLLWHDQYRLIQNGNGALKAPQFLQLAGNKIFTTGKSIAFLKMLGVEISTQVQRPSKDSIMSYESVCSIADPHNLMPFSELFDKTFAKWIASKQRSSSMLLRRELESHYGLSRAFKALGHIYLYSNAALSNNAVRPLFQKIELGNQRWNDAFSTIEPFRDAFVTVGCIDIDRIIIRPDASKHMSNIKERSMDVLEKLHVAYVLPWPIANIVTSQSMMIYQRVFVLLTQLERSRFLLQREKLSLNVSKTVYSIHTNLLWFVNTVLSHITTLVIAANTKALYEDMTDAEDIDAMIAIHQAYISKLEDQCLLAKKHVPLLRAVVSILDLTVLFSDLQASDGRRDQGPKSGRSDSFSSGEGDQDDDVSQRAAKTDRDAESPSTERLVSIHDTYKQLLAIVTASVENIRKADGGLIWTVLASHLAFGAPP